MKNYKEKDKGFIFTSLVMIGKIKGLFGTGKV